MNRESERATVFGKRSGDPDGIGGVRRSDQHLYAVWFGELGHVADIPRMNTFAYGVLAARMRLGRAQPIKLRLRKAVESCYLRRKQGAKSIAVVGLSPAIHGSISHF